MDTPKQQQGFSLGVCVQQGYICILAHHERRICHLGGYEIHSPAPLAGGCRAVACPEAVWPALRVREAFLGSCLSPSLCAEMALCFRCFCSRTAERKASRTPSAGRRARILTEPRKCNVSAHVVALFHRNPGALSPPVLSDPVATPSSPVRRIGVKREARRVFFVSLTPARHDASRLQLLPRLDGAVPCGPSGPGVAVWRRTACG